MDAKIGRRHFVRLGAAFGVVAAAARRAFGASVGAPAAGEEAHKGEAALQPVPKTRRVASIRRMLEGEGQFDELFSRDHKSHKPWDVASKSAKGFADLDRVFSDMQVTVVDAVEGGDKVWVRWRLRGKLSGEFARIKPTGRPIDITGVNIYRFAGDKIVESWGEFDVPTLSQQAFGGLSAEQCQEALQVLSRPADTLPVR